MGTPIPPAILVEQPYIRRIAIVFLYGCDLQTPLKHYLDDIASWANAHPQDSFILCGGPTQQKSAPDTTEARVAYEYLTGVLRHQPEWFLEEQSFTTRENAVNAARIVDMLKRRPWKGTVPRHDEITVWCEATRALKVAKLVREFLGFPPKRGEPDIRIKTDSWERAQPTTMLISTLKDWVSLPHQLHRWYRRYIRAKRS